MIRNILFRTAYWTTSIVFALLSIPLLLLPGRRPLMLWILLYTKLMVFWMRIIAGIKPVTLGRDHLPTGPCIIAAKHQSWGDGFLMFSQFYDLAFVTGDHLEKFPIVGSILRKMGNIIVDNCGGVDARKRLLSKEMARARADGRRILIYPEGHLSAVGHYHRYRKGVWHLYRDYNCPVVPVATNLGLFWPQQESKLTAGDAVIEFLPAIEPGLDKETFMHKLEQVIETRSIELLPKDRQPANGQSRLEG
ncbi:MAG: lysophospholipid acyltransferase family protein [bacterium]